MSGKIAVLSCLIVLFSCRKEKTPPGVLTQSQMTAWMIEVYLAEARSGSWPVSRDSAYKLFLPRQDTLKHKLGIADSTLVKSYEYYLGHPLELEAIYDVVIDSLNLREQRMMKSISITQ